MKLAFPPLFMLSYSCSAMTTVYSCDVPISAAKKATASYQKALVLWEHLGIQTCIYLRNKESYGISEAIQSTPFSPVLLCGPA